MNAPPSGRASYAARTRCCFRYVVVWVHKGKQHKSYYVTIAETREANGKRAGDDRTSSTKATFEDYAIAWLDSYRGRTSRGLDDPPARRTATRSSASPSRTSRVCAWPRSTRR